MSYQKTRPVCIPHGDLIERRDLSALRAARCLGVSGFFVSSAVFVSVALITLFLSSDRPTAAGDGMSTPDTAVCVRVRRDADYTVVLLPVGKPTRIAQVLLRLDKVVDEDPLWLLSSANEQSSQLNCSSTHCFDAGLIQQGHEGRSRHAHISYSYRSAAADSSFANVWLGLKGEMSIQRGLTYWLGTTRVCWAPTAIGSISTPGDIHLNTETGYLIGNSTRLTPSCPPGLPVQMFPIQASLERYWLVLHGSFLREHASAMLEERRNDAEMGIDCGSEDSPYARDCTAAARCMSSPSVPYRRLSATKNLIIRTVDNEATVTIEATPSLGRIPGILSPDHALVVALSRLALTVLVSLVAYIRKSQKSSDSLWMVLQSWDRVATQEPCTCPDTTASMTDVYVDAVIGLLSIGSRFSVVIIMKDSLWADGMHMVVVSEVIGCTVSLCHFFLRHPPVLDLDLNLNLPVTKLGGSMALLDTSLAILVSFVTPPAFGSHHGYAGLGRLLATLLFCVSAIPLAVFACVSCGILAGGLYYDRCCDLRFHARLLIVSIILWLLQLASSSITVAHVFCRVFSFQLFRVYSGGHTQMSIILFCVCFITSVPTQNKVILGICKGIQAKTHKTARLAD